MSFGEDPKSNQKATTDTINFVSLSRTYSRLFSNSEYQAVGRRCPGHRGEHRCLRLLVECTCTQEWPLLISDKEKKQRGGTPYLC